MPIIYLALLSKHPQKPLFVIHPELRIIWIKEYAEYAAATTMKNGWVIKMDVNAVS